MNNQSVSSPSGQRRSVWRFLAVSGLLLSVVLLLSVPPKTLAQGKTNIGDENGDPTEEAVQGTENTSAVLTLLNASDNQISYTQSGNIFCRVLYLQETAGVRADSVTITVTDLAGSSGITTQPKLSRTGCGAENEATSPTVLTSLRAYSVTQIWYMVELNQATTYSGLILIQLPDQAAERYSIEIERTGQEMTAGLAISTPAPVEGVTNPIGDFWNTAAILPFTIDSTNGEVINLEKPELRALNEMNGDTIEKEVSGIARPTLMPQSESTLTPGAGQTVSLTVNGLPAGKYQAEIAVPTEDGRRISGTGTFYIRHPWVFPIVFIFVAVVIVELVRYLNTTGKSKDEARYKLSFIWSNFGRLKSDADQIEGIPDRDKFVEVFDELERWFGVDFQIAEQDSGAERLNQLVQDSSTRLDQAKIFLDNVESVGIHFETARKQADTDWKRTSLEELHVEFGKNRGEFGRLLCSNDLSRKTDGTFDKDKIVTELQQVQEALTTLNTKAQKLPYTWRLQALQDSTRGLQESEEQKNFLTSLGAIEQDINELKLVEAEKKLKAAYKKFLSLYSNNIRQIVNKLPDSDQKEALLQKLTSADSAIEEDKLSDAENSLQRIYKEAAALTPQPKTLEAADADDRFHSLGLLSSWGEFPKLPSRRSKSWTEKLEESLNRLKIQRRRAVTNLFSVLLTVVIAVVAAFLTQVLNQPDFGGIEDYLVLFLFVLGGNALTTSTLTDVRFSNLRSYLGES